MHKEQAGFLEPAGV